MPIIKLAPPPVPQEITPKLLLDISCVLRQNPDGISDVDLAAILSDAGHNIDLVPDAVQMLIDNGTIKSE